MIVRGSCLATEVGVSGLIVAHETHETRTGATHTAFEQLLHKEGRAIWDDLFCLGGCLVDDVAVAVFDLGHKDRIDMATVVDRGAVGIYHLKQIDIAGTECERGCWIELRLDTHIVGSLDNIVNTAFLTQTYGDGVDTHGEGLFQRDVST